MVIQNIARSVVAGGLRSWRRNLATGLPALATAWLLLALAGTMGIVGVSVHHLLADYSKQASVVEVYLSDSATQDEVAALRTRLAADPGVISIRYASKEEALASARRDPVLMGIASPNLAAGGDNPFPASLEVRNRSLGDVDRVAAIAAASPGVDARNPSSFSRDLYEHLTRLILTGGVVAACLLLLPAGVTVAVTASSVRGSVLARRQEVAVMRLVGAPRWLVEGPFVVDAMITGALAGVLAAALVAGSTLAAAAAQPVVFEQFLPGVDRMSLAATALTLIGVGSLLGAASASLALCTLRTT